MDPEILSNEFILEEADPSTILVRHLIAGVRFLFVIKGRRLDGQMGREPQMNDLSLRNQARIFALREARLRGFVD
ncbi:MAG TPA: hypothetical protein VME69_12795 [Methylocella sp.]|nr:hypothetical protein [Methylocella sp.]